MDSTMEYNAKELSEKVVGRKIISAEKSDNVPTAYGWGRHAGLKLTLDDGSIVHMADTDDCCAYTALDSFLLHPDKVDHVITGVSLEDDAQKWHIYADMGDVLELSVGWSEGSGYYGYGFDITVSNG